MGHHSAHRHWVVLGGIAALAAVGALILRGSGTPEVSSPEKVAASNTLVAQPTKVASSEFTKPPASAAGPATGSLSPPQRPTMMPTELIEQVLTEDKKLGNFMYYHKHVLLDERGRNEYRKLLSDPDLMKAMAKDLMDPGKGEVEPKEHYHRLMQIDYFDAALNWADNPQRQHLIELVGDIILKDNFSSGQDLDRRQMLAGGKMELYRLMYEADVSKALDIVAQAKGTRMERLTNWMAEENLRRRAKEEQIRVEMQEQQTKAANSANP